MFKEFLNFMLSLNPFGTQSFEGFKRRIIIQPDTSDEAIARDWLAVGNDMRRVMGEKELSFEEAFPEYMHNE